MLKSEKTVSKTIFWKDSANGARGIRARAYVGDDAHEADAARGRRRDPPEIGWDALRQPATPHRCVSRRKRRPRPEQRRVHFFAPKRGEETRVVPPFGGDRRARAPRTRPACASPRPRRPRAPPRAVTRANTPPSLAASCRVASRQNIFSERKIAGIGFGRFAASLVDGAFDSSKLRRFVSFFFFFRFIR